MLNPCPDDIRRRVLGYLGERFGFDVTLLDPWELYLSESARQKVFLGPKTVFPLDRTDTGGVLIARAGDTIKPATSFFQMFGRHVVRNIVRLQTDQVVVYCAGGDITLAPDQIGEAKLGFVMVAWEDRPLGCGLLREGGVMENQVPKANRVRLERW